MEQTYKIGEVASLLNLKTYVLRFWETEFPQIAPLRTEKGQRLYREKDVELLERIRYLLHEQGLTIDGARKILDNHEAESFIPTSPTAVHIPSPMELTKPAPEVLLNQAHNQPTSQLPSQLSSQLPGQPVSQLSGQSPTRSPDQSPNQSSDKFLGHSQAQSPAQSPAQSSGAPSVGSSASMPGDSVSHMPATTVGAASAPMPNSVSDNAQPHSLQPENASWQAIVTELEEIAALLRCDMTKGNYTR